MTFEELKTKMAATNKDGNIGWTTFKNGTEAQTYYEDGWCYAYLFTERDDKGNFNCRYIYFTRDEEHNPIKRKMFYTYVTKETEVVTKEWEEDIC